MKGFRRDVVTTRPPHFRPARCRSHGTRPIASARSRPRRVWAFAKTVASRRRPLRARPRPAGRAASRLSRSRSRRRRHRPPRALRTGRDSAHPLEVESGGVHQVKPWFEGRVDFAPVVGFGGDDDFPRERGGHRVLPRPESGRLRLRAAPPRHHLVLYRADGLPWPTVPVATGGTATSAMRSSPMAIPVSSRRSERGSSADTKPLRDCEPETDECESVGAHKSAAPQGVEGVQPGSSCCIIETVRIVS